MLMYSFLNMQKEKVKMLWNSNVTSQTEKPLDMSYLVHANCDSKNKNGIYKMYDFFLKTGQYISNHLNSKSAVFPECMTTILLYKFL